LAGVVIWAIIGVGHCSTAWSFVLFQMNRCTIGSNNGDVVVLVRLRRGNGFQFFRGDETFDVGIVAGSGFSFLSFSCSGLRLEVLRSPFSSSGTEIFVGLHPIGGDLSLLNRCDDLVRREGLIEKSSSQGKQHSSEQNCYAVTYSTTT